MLRLLMLAFLASCATIAPAQSQPAPEVVMTPGMQISAVTKTGQITITAGDGFERSYTWEGATRSVEMRPRAERWYGSLGLYFPGPGDHWEMHDGISRGVLEEGQRHFASEAEAMEWLRSRSQGLPLTYNDSGLVVVYGKVLPRRQLSVEVWQIDINGKKPAHLPGSDNASITVTKP